ncbi:MAG: hypothetical protein GKR94_17620 [Gammaproteobacteria bacterium]|nr:hypothetical protein [Gammaproteobacteria bacterium]
MRFLSARAADEFALFGSFGDITEQLRNMLEAGIPVGTVLPRPMVLPDTGVDYVEDFASNATANW